MSAANFGAVSASLTFAGLSAGLYARGPAGYAEDPKPTTYRDITVDEMGRPDELTILGRTAPYMSRDHFSEKLKRASKRAKKDGHAGVRLVLCGKDISTNIWENAVYDAQCDNRYIEKATRGEIDPKSLANPIDYINLNCVKYDRLVEYADQVVIRHDGRTRPLK